MLSGNYLHLLAIADFTSESVFSMLCNSEIHRHSNTKFCFWLEYSRAIPPPWPQSQSPSPPRCYQCCPSPGRSIHHYHAPITSSVSKWRCFVFAGMAGAKCSGVASALSLSLCLLSGSATLLDSHTASGADSTAAGPDRQGADIRVWRRESTRSHTGRLFRKS